MTLHKDSPVITYRGNGKIRRFLHSVSLNFRTRKQEATLLLAERESDHITVSLQDGRLVLELQVVATNVATFTFLKAVVAKLLWLADSKMTGLVGCFWYAVVSATRKVNW